MKCPPVLVLLCFVATANSIHLTGRFGGQAFPTDIQFGKDKMVVTIRRPDHAQATFRETTNLHIFSTHVVAVRNSVDKQCYIYHFNESMDIMLGRVQNAEYNNGELNNLMEHRMILRDTAVEAPHRIQRLMGGEIVKFCEGHVVYLMRSEDIIRLHPNDISLKRREKRRVINADVAGYCDDCQSQEERLTTQ